MQAEGKMTMPSNTHEERVPDLAAYLMAAGVLDLADRDSRAWLQALDEVPRHQFVPARAWAQPQDDRPDCLIDRGTGPDAWWDAVYSNTAIITQRSDGEADVSDTDAAPTSSISSPHVAAEFLRLLDVAPHHHVLEIGTGTGWTAAMLAWRLRDDQVTSIEVDEGVAAQAVANLKACGYAPTVLTGDGALGAADGAPYDRIHVTCGVRDIPYAWIEQIRPGGSIVLPWMPRPGGWGYQLRLDVLDDGVAAGTFHGECGFMMLRSQRRRAWPHYSDDQVESITRVNPREIWAALDHGFDLALAAHAPHIAITSGGWEQDEDWSGWRMRLRDIQGGSWAMAAAVPGEDTQVSQGGRRQLWPALESAFMEWLRAGRPGIRQYRMLVSSTGQAVWLH